MAWVIIEVLSGIPANVWVCQSEKSAETLAADIAADLGLDWQDGHYWTGGDTDLYIHVAQAEPGVSQ